jgi:hypothetical protein
LTAPGDLLRHLFEVVVQRCLDASLIRADASKQRSCR